LIEAHGAQSLARASAPRASGPQYRESAENDHAPEGGHYQCDGYNGRDDAARGMVFAAQLATTPFARHERAAIAPTTPGAAK
jgi:hypothetical protein